MTKATILIVEDEALIAQDIKEILEEHQYSVLGIVDNGPDALQLTKTKKPDIILMDIIIKGPWDGIKTTEEIHAVIDTPVIYLTSHADNVRLERAKITEPYGYITKPFEEKTLYSTIEIALYKRKTEFDKQALKEKVIQLNRELSLTENERIVFYGLIRYPLLNDIELGRVLRLKRSTVTAIRNRLLKENYYTSFRIPDFSAIGCELLTMMNCTLNTTREISIQKDLNVVKDLNISKDTLNNLFSEILSETEQVYAAYSTKRFMGFSLSKNYSDSKRHIDKVSTQLKNIFAGNELTYTHFSIHSQTLKNFFNFSNYVKKRLDIHKDYDYFDDEKKPSAKTRILSKNEKIILYALVKYPESDDTELSSKTGIPRPSISQVRRSLIHEGLLQTINMPSLTNLKSELLVMDDMIVTRDQENKLASEEMSQLIKRPSNIFLASDDTEAYTINVYDDYSEFESEKSLMAASSNDTHLKIKQEIIMIIQGLYPVYFNPSPIVKDLLGIDPKF